MAKEKNTVDKKLNQFEKDQIFNPLLATLRENDKNNMFQSNAVLAFHKTGYPLFDYFFGTVANIHDDKGNLTSQERRIGQAYGTFNLIIGNSGSGKGQPVSTILPAPNNDHHIIMKNIKIGDMLFDRYGKPTKVIGIFPQGKMDIYKITFNDGRKAFCDKNHLWEVYHTYKNGNLIKEIKNIMDIYKDYVSVIGKNDIKRYKYKIKLLDHYTSYKYKRVPIDPYILGAFIGNGSFREEYLTFSSNDEFIPNMIANAYNLNIRHFKNSYIWRFYNKETGKPIRTADFFKDIPELINSYSRNKIIPEDYIYNSFSIRMSLLKGLMDTNGSIFKSKRDNSYAISYSSCSKKLVDQILEILYSLGWSGTISKDNRKNKYTNGCCWNIKLRVPYEFYSMFFLLPRKLEITNKAIKNNKNHKYQRDKKFITITDIRFHHKEESICIKVDNPEEMYLTEHYIPTHNTTLAVQMGANIIRQYPYSNVIHFDCENRFDASRCENITNLAPKYFENGSYIIKNGMVGLNDIQETIAKIWYDKMNMQDQASVIMPYKDEFNHDIKILQPSIVIIDSITTVLNESYDAEASKKSMDEAGSMRGNTEGARDARTLKGFFKDVLPMCKEANIIIYGINHINVNMSMNSFIPVARQQNFMKQDEIIPGGKTMLYYPHNIVKLTAKPSDNFTIETDGFNGHIVMVEPVKSSCNQSGNNSKGISFNLVFSYQKGFDNLRSLILYGKENGFIDGNRNRMKFKDDDSFTFNWKELSKEVNEKPIWECTKKFIIPALDTHLPFIDLSNSTFDMRSLDY